MPPKKQTAVIQSRAFAGTDELDADDFEALRISDTKDAASKLVQEWSSGCIGMVCLKLSNDNRKVEASSLLLLGSLFEDQPRVISTEKFWPGSKAKLVLRELDCEIFSFTNSLVSNLVDSSQLDWAFKASNRGPDLSDAEAQEKNLTAFSIRCHITPLSETTAQAHLVLFPLALKDLETKYPLASDPRFPSLELCAPIVVNLAPPQREVIQDRSWGQPIMPALLKPAPFPEDGPFPPSSLLKKALAFLLMSAVKPDVKRSFNYLTPLWEKSLDEGRDALRTLSLDAQWPTPGAVCPPEGKCFSCFLFSFFVGSFLSFCFFFYFHKFSFCVAALSVMHFFLSLKKPLPP